MGHPSNRAERRFQRERVLEARRKTILENKHHDKVLFYKQDHPFCERYNKSFHWAFYLGKFSKKRPFDCGSSGCHLCHFSKVFYKKYRRNQNKDQLRKQDYDD